MSQKRPSAAARERSRPGRVAGRTACRRTVIPALACAAALGACSFPLAAPTPIHPAVPAAPWDATVTPFLPVPVTELAGTAATSPLGFSPPTASATSALPALGIIRTATPTESLGIAPSPGPSAAAATAETAPGETGQRSALLPIAEDIIARVNRDRGQLGLPALQAPSGLMEIAFQRAEAIVSGGAFVHVDPLSGNTPAEALVGAGYGGRLAETLYASTAPIAQIAAETVAAWMGSAENRAVLLDFGYRYAGVGITGDGTWWTITQMLAETGP